MGRPNVTIVKQNGKLGRRAPNTDAVFGMVLSALAIAGAGNLQNGVVYQMVSIKDAVAIGITPDYDTTNSVLVYHHINRFFIRNPNGKLWVITAPQTATLTTMTDPAGAYAPVLLRAGNGAVKYWGVARNPATGYTPVLTAGLDDDVITAVANAQALCDAEFILFRYADCVIEGRSFNGTAAAATDLRSLSATNVSVTIAADPAISALGPLTHGYAALGDILGIISLAAVSQDCGELTPGFNLQNTGLGLFVTAGLSSNLPVSSYSDADLDALNGKGYIFPDVTTGIDGYYISDSHTCDVIAGNDYAYIENNRTIEKAIYLARTAILPLVKARLKVDPNTGLLLPQVCKTIETKGNRSLAGMQTDGDISGGIDTYVDPNQNLLAGAALTVEITFVPVSIGRAITLSIGFSNPLNS